MKVIHNVKVVGLLGVLLCQVRVQADGVLPPPLNDQGDPIGVFGANRRVTTGPAGYTAVKGSFTVPEIKVTLPYSSSLLGLANSKPTFYLGSSKRDGAEFLEVDAGVQHEWEIIPYRDPQTQQIESAQPGWTIFVRSSGNDSAFIGGYSKFKSPRLGYRAPTGVRSFDLAWAMTARAQTSGGGYRGTLHAVVNGSGTNTAETFEVVADGDYSDFLCFSVAGMRVKRIVGMTQGGSYRKDPFNPGRRPMGAWLRFPLPQGGLYDEDGSYMRGCDFLNGQVSLKTPRVGDQAPNWIPWSQNANRADDLSSNFDEPGEPTSTGYYPGGKDHTILNLTIAGKPIFPIAPPAVASGSHPKARPIFEFPSLAQADWNGTKKERYDNETISINLENATPVQGTDVRPGG